MEMSIGEKLIALMLCGLYDHLGVKSEIDPARVRDALASGHIWGIKEQLGWMVANEDSSEALRKEVGDLLWMWAYLEDAYDRLDEAGQAELERLAPHSTPVRFYGFDGNHECEFISVARWLLKNPEFLNGKFKDRALNAHHATIDGYRRMYERFEAALQTPGRDFGSSLMDARELADVLTARRHQEAAG